MAVDKIGQAKARVEAAERVAKEALVALSGAQDQEFAARREVRLSREALDLAEAEASTFTERLIGSQWVRPHLRGQQGQLVVACKLADEAAGLEAHDETDSWMCASSELAAELVRRLKGDDAFVLVRSGLGSTVLKVRDA